MIEERFEDFVTAIERIANALEQIVNQLVEWRLTELDWEEKEH